VLCERKDLPEGIRKAHLDQNRKTEGPSGQDGQQPKHLVMGKYHEMGGGKILEGGKRIRQKPRGAGQTVGPAVAGSFYTEVAAERHWRGGGWVGKAVQRKTKQSGVGEDIRKSITIVIGSGRENCWAGHDGAIRLGTVGEKEKKGLGNHRPDPKERHEKYEEWDAIALRTG